MFFTQGNEFIKVRRYFNKTLILNIFYDPSLQIGWRMVVHFSAFILPDSLIAIGATHTHFS